VAVERTAKGPDEREVDGAVDLTQQVILRHEMVQGEVVVKLRLEPRLLLHHRAALRLWRPRAHIDHITYHLEFGHRPYA
jgi:hypothetical protein